MPIVLKSNIGGQSGMPVESLGLRSGGDIEYFCAFPRGGLFLGHSINQEGELHTVTQFQLIKNRP